MSPAFTRTPRLLHPAAWWLWGLAMAIAASRTTNPFLLLLIICVVSWVVLERREVGMFNPLLPFLLIGLFAIGLRIVMVTLFGDSVAGRVVIFRLPEVPLPEWSSGVRIGGAVTLEGVLFAVYDGLRMATILVCLGAVNALASPRRLLRYVPATLHEVGTAVVVALTFAPQLIEDARRVRAARRLRGHTPRRITDLPRLAVPVLVGALERSLDLAASMESRGYGRVVQRTTGSTRLAGLFTLVGLTGLIVGLYGLLDATSPLLLGWPMLALGVVAALTALAVGVKQDQRTHYRRERWAIHEWLLALTAAVPAVVMAVAASAQWAGVVPPQVPAHLPVVPVPLVAAILVGALAVAVTPLPPVLAQTRARRDVGTSLEVPA